MGGIAFGFFRGENEGLAGEAVLDGVLGGSFEALGADGTLRKLRVLLICFDLGGC
jgi:hypothetical protein